MNPLTLGARPPVALGALLMLAVWCTTVAQFMWFSGLAAAPDITRASYIFFLKPVIAAALAILVLGDWPSALQVAAIALVTGCVVVEMSWGRLRGLFAR